MALPWHESKLIIPISLTLVFHSHPKREQIQRPREKDVSLCLEVFLFSNGDLTAKPQRPVLTKGISETLSELLAPRNLFLGVQPSQHLVPRTPPTLHPPLKQTKTKNKKENILLYHFHEVR